MNKAFEELTSKELRVVCRENGISYSYTENGVKHTMTKDEMVNALYDKLDADANGNAADEAGEAEMVMVPEEEDDGYIHVETASLDQLYDIRWEVEKQIAIKRAEIEQATAAYAIKMDKKQNPDYDEAFSMYAGVDPTTYLSTRNKEKYIEEAEVGTLFAFLDENGKPRTGALVKRNSDKRAVKLETEYGWQFLVPYEVILWVKRGNQWSPNLYRMLKRYNPNGRCETELPERKAKRIESRLSGNIQIKAD